MMLGQPLSLAQAMDFSDEGRFICTAEFPYGVMYANKSWTRLTGYQQHEIEGKDMCFMQGALTDTVSVIQMMCSVQLTGYGKANLVNYTKSGRPFWCEIQIQPIMSKDMYGDEQITHLLGTLVKTATVDMPKTSSCSTSPSDRGSEWRTGTSTSDSESGSVSSWNSTSDNGGNSPFRDSGDDSSEEVSNKRPNPSKNQHEPTKRPRLENNHLSSRRQPTNNLPEIRLFP